jgi:AcrR family transcriptional regulator
MAPGRRSSSTARDARAKRSDSANRPKGSTRTAIPRTGPIYKRLPHGPHRLERNEVVLHQRARIHGAMVEAVACHGYEGTSVKQVITLAGVSRRSFYEQFANKEECFLTTFDLIVRRQLKQVKRVYLATHGPLEQRAQAVFEQLAQVTTDDRNAILLVALEAQRAGPAGVMRLRRATGICEHMLARSFAESAGATALPMPIVRGIAGGLHGVVAAFLRDGHTAGSVDLAGELLHWTLLFQTSAAEEMAERLSAGMAARMREVSSAHGNRLGGAEAPGRDERTRLLQSILRLIVREDYRALSPPQIADEANVSIDSFCELFTDKHECFLAAIDMVGDELLTIAADPDLVSDEWPRAVRSVLAELTRYLADRPLQARTLAHEALFAGGEALARTVDLFHSIATLLTEGAPVEPDCSLITEAIAGAIWHTIRCQVAAERIELLAALSDHLSYLVLAPFLGADAAAAIVSEELAPASASAAYVPPAQQSA